MGFAFSKTRMIVDWILWLTQSFLGSIHPCTNSLQEVLVGKLHNLSQGIQLYSVAALLAGASLYAVCRL